MLSLPFNLTLSPGECSSPLMMVLVSRNADVLEIELCLHCKVLEQFAALVTVTATVFHSWAYTVDDYGIV